MLQLIETEYQGHKEAGVEVEEIQMSQIAMDHLRAELSNRSSAPEWLPLIRVTKVFQEHRIITRERSQPISA